MDNSPSNHDLEEVKTGDTPEQQKRSPMNKRLHKKKVQRKNTTDPSSPIHKHIKSPAKEINSAVPALEAKHS